MHPASASAPPAGGADDRPEGKRLLARLRDPRRAVRLRAQWSRLPPLARGIGVAVVLMVDALGGDVAPGAFVGLPCYGDSTEALTRSFWIPAEDASRSLEMFSEQSGAQILYIIEHVRGVTTNAVKGRYTPRDALLRMAENTTLVVVEDKKSGAFIIKHAPAPGSPRPPDFQAKPRPGSAGVRPGSPRPYP